ncbi:MAG: hypothetical protein Q8Q08_01810 [Candidatus Omnitrophota bacterium]|nr:hypothetical protein [Candidatus Omnitrophota bacterium]MDZ4242776.1 hypothetical protein [Candidatus Omnitrophota bacterium]
MNYILIIAFILIAGGLFFIFGPSKGNGRASGPAGPAMPNLLDWLQENGRSALVVVFAVLLIVVVWLYFSLPQEEAPGPDRGAPAAKEKIFTASGMARDYLDEYEAKLMEYIPKLKKAKNSENRAEYDALVEQMRSEVDPIAERFKKILKALTPKDFNPVYARYQRIHKTYNALRGGR